MVNVGERIRQLRKANKLTQNELSKRIGLSSNVLSDYERGKVRNIPFTTIEAMSKVFGVPNSYFLDERDLPKKFALPVLGDIKAGLPIEAVQNIIDYEEVDERMSNTDEWMALRVKGDSMSPRICDGDVVILERCTYVDSGQIAAILIDNEVTLKKVKWLQNGALQLLPFNQSYEPMYFTMEEIKSIPVTFIGRLVELRGKF